MACSPGDSGPPMLVVTAYSAPGQAAQTNGHNDMSRANNCQKDTPSLKIEFNDKVESN